jgi:hypothetical protein
MTDPCASYVTTRLMAAEILLEEAHAVLDARGVPRTGGGAPVTLATRIRALVGERVLDPIGPGRRHDLDSTPAPDVMPVAPDEDDYIPRDAHYRQSSNGG